MSERNDNEVVVAGSFKISDLWRKEDWLSIWIAFIITAVAAVGALTGAFDFSGAKFGSWAFSASEFTDPAKARGAADVLTMALAGKLALTFAVFALFFAVANRLEGHRAFRFVAAFAGMFALVSVVRFLSAEATCRHYLEYAFWALLLGLVVSNTVKTPQWLRPALRTELYIKTGLVLLGAQVLFSNIQKFGLYGLGIAWGVTPVVIVFMWWYGVRVLKMSNQPLVITVAAATSVCGTSAAIAAAAAARAKKTDLAFAVGSSLIFTVIMMVGMPFFIKAIHVDPMIGGAWIGGTVDSTGAVVLAGQALGDVGGQVAALVKMIQNILIGFIAFFVAVFFATRVDRTGNQKVGAGEIWTRFPKFILGFFVASLVASFVIMPAFGSDQVSAINKVLDQYKNWAFVLAFTSIGLDTNFKEIIKQMQGGKVLWLYIIGQLFNIALTFFAVWFLLSGKIFPIPVLD